jgi:uncharacterized membrane protein YhaH (DUF805 family)
MHWYLDVLKKFAVFGGRARRKEFWVFALVNLLATLILGFVDVATGLVSEQAGIGLFSGIYSLGVLVPYLAVSVRRLHDTGRTGWWLLIGLIPLIGSIVLLVFFVLDGEPGQNRYGVNPKAIPV